MLTNKWLTLKTQRNQLAAILHKARKQNWSRWIRTAADRKAILEGCTFNIEAAQRVRTFFKKFIRHSTGKWAGKPFELLDWQWEQIVAPLFGWLKPDGNRRFDQAFVTVAKKVGKSTLASAIILYLLVADGELGAQVYCAANDSKQANIVYRECVNMVEASPLLKERLGIYRSTGRITYERKGSFFSRMSADAYSKEGINAHAVIYDELHVATNRIMWDTLRYSMVAREQPILMVITTAGVDTQGICYEQYQYAKKILSGEILDTSFLAVVYESEPDDDIDDPETWRKANPSLGVTIDEAKFKSQLEEAKTSPRKMTSFLRYRLNRWVETADRWIDPAKWDECRGELPENSSLLPCWLGLDLADNSDINALVAVWKGENQLFVRPVFWCPEDTVRERTLEGVHPYHEWVRDGFLRTTEGAVTDYDEIKQALIDLVENNALQQVAYDPWQALKLVNELSAEGIPCVKVPQTISHLSEPSKELEKLVLGGGIVHDGNPVMRWMIANASITQDTNENIRPNKKKSGEKIDGVAALVTALARVIVAEDSSEPYDGVGMVIL